MFYVTLRLLASVASVAVVIRFITVFGITGITDPVPLTRCLKATISPGSSKIQRPRNHMRLVLRFPAPPRREQYAQQVFKD
jgi:hypothetical protein